MNVSEAARALESVVDATPAPETQEEKKIQPRAEEQSEEVEGEATDEVENEELDESEGNSTEEGSEDNEASEGEAEEPLYEVAINGQTKKVNLDELKANFSKGEDYIRKTEEVANERKAIVEEKQKVLQNQARLIEEYEFVEGLLSQPEMSHEQLMQLRDSDFEAYQRYKDDVQQRKDALNSLRAQKKAHQEAYQTQIKEATDRYLKDEMSKLVHDMPEFKPAEGQKMTSTEAWQGMSKYLKAFGYDDDAVNAITDHRFVKIIEKARKFDALMAKKPAVEKKAQDAPKVMKSGSRATKAEQQAKARKEQLGKLRKTGRVEDAAAALMSFV